MPRFLAAAVIGALLAAPAMATPPELDGRIAAPAPLGSSTFSKLIWTLYDAKLWTPNAAPHAWARPFALSLTYRMDFTRDELVDSSIDEMARITGSDASAYERYRPDLERCFRDVVEGDRITGYSDAAQQVRFFLNGAETCVVADTAFSRAFFGIWLDPATRGAASRAALLGGGS